MHDEKRNWFEVHLWAYIPRLDTSRDLLGFRNYQRAILVLSRPDRCPRFVGKWLCRRECRRTQVISLSAKSQPKWCPTKDASLPWNWPPSCSQIPKQLSTLFGTQDLPGALTTSAVPWRPCGDYFVLRRTPDERFSPLQSTVTSNIHTRACTDWRVT